MSDLVVHTFDRVPDMARGYVRDLRVRWALEEAGLPYRVAGVPIRERGAEHFAHQPFGQVPWLTDGDISIFETGAILLYLAERSEKLMPRDAQGRARVLEWTIAALNSIETASLPWAIFKLESDASQTPGKRQLDTILAGRLGHMETVLAAREYLAGSFSIADIQMAEALRVVDSLDGLAEHPACKAYVARAISRPAFVKAHADQLAHFAKAD
ncbi:glutathione S-transferase family protein [Halotia wernerae UHCC 0503]|nr:glutathione S-transferase family protein [Halotia wernerae UHCC 0503]